MLTKHLVCAKHAEASFKLPINLLSRVPDEEPALEGRESDHNCKDMSSCTLCVCFELPFKSAFCFSVYIFLVCNM